MKKIIGLLVLAIAMTAVLALMPSPAAAQNIGNLPDGSAYLPPGDEVIVVQPPTTTVNPTTPPDNGGTKKEGGTTVGSPNPPTTSKRTELPKTGGYPEISLLIGLSMMALGAAGVIGYGRFALIVKD